MLEVLTGLFDTTGFPPRRECGTGWTPALIWLHMTSDLFIWLAYLSIPLILLYFTRLRNLPFPRLFVLFAIFILSCGTTHLIDAMIFDYPIYRFGGVMKFITAIASWATVMALIPIVPRVMNAVAEANKPGTDTKFHRPLAGRRPDRTRGYIVGILAGVMAVLLRAALDPLLIDDHIFVVALLAVVFVSWQHGFGPAVVCLSIAAVGYTYFFVPPRGSLFVTSTGTQLAIALFFFCGVACSALGESQRSAQRRARNALNTAVARREELEGEIVRRRVVEASLRLREQELLDAQRETGETLARLNAFLDNAPLGIAFFDPDLRYERINPFLAEANGKSVEEHSGRTLTEMVPDFPAEMAAAYRRAASPAGEAFTAQFRRPDRRHPTATRVWQVNAFPVRVDGRGVIGAGIVAQDVTDRLNAEEDLKRSEDRFRRTVDEIAIPTMMHADDDQILLVNKAWTEITGYGPDELRTVDDWTARAYGTERAPTREYIDSLFEAAARVDSGEWEVTTASGAKRLWHFYSTPLGREAGGRRLMVSNAIDITDSKRAAVELAERARASSLRAEVAAALASADETRVALQECAAILVRQVDAAFARVWTADTTGEWLELQASAGQFTRTDGQHDRVRFGQFKIGRIAQSRTPHLSNDVRNDPNVSDQEWVAREGMVSFAGYPLIADGRVLGVVALFARHTLSASLLGDLEPVAASIAQHIARRAAADAVRRSAERFRTLTEAVPQVVWKADADGEVTYFNRRWLEYTGVTMDDARGRGWMKAVHPDDRDRVYAAWRQTVDRVTPGEGDRFAEELRLAHGDTGAYRWFQSVAIPLRHADGRVDQWIGSMADIHEQKSAAKHVAEANDFLEATLNALSSHIAVLDADGVILMVNDAWRRFGTENGLELSGYGVGANYLDQCGTDASDLPAETTNGIRAVIRGDRAEYDTEYPCHAPDRKRWFHMRVNRFPGGGPVRVAMSHEDITKRVLAEEQTRETEEMFRQLAESIPQLAWMTDPEGFIFWYNQRWFDYTGTTLEDMKGWGWAAVHDPAELPRVVAKFKAHLASGEPWEDTFPIRGHDGIFRWHLSRARPMRDAGGAVVRWFGTNTDITAQREMEQTLERLVRERTVELTNEIDDRKAAEQQVRTVATELERSNGELEKFAYVASHDLQEPLRKIQEFGDRLLTKCRAQLPDTGKEYVDRMLSAAGRMRRLIDDLLTFSRVTTQKRPFVRVDLDKLVCEVLSDLDERVTQAGATVRVGPLTEVDADYTQMRQVFQNLIANAIKFQQPGVPPVVEVEGEAATMPPADPEAGEPIPAFRFTVRDNGIGFDEKYRNRIFNVFQRLHGREEYEGTGVGLAICRKIVERHGGTITAYSQEGQGAAFVVTIPLRQSHTDEDTDAQQDPAGRHTDGG